MSNTITAHFQGGPWHGRMVPIHDRDIYELIEMPDLDLDEYDPYDLEPPNEPITYQVHFYRKTERVRQDAWIFQHIDDRY